MSITIYDGMRSDAGSAFDVALQARAVLEPLFFSKAKNLIEILESRGGDTPEDVFDLRESLGKTYDAEHAVFAAVEHLKRATNHTFSRADIGYELMLLPSYSDDSVLALIYSEDKSYREALINSGLFRDFGYWDNSDAPEEETVESWRARRHIWGWMTEENRAPVSVALSINQPSSLAYALWEQGYEL